MRTQLWIVALSVGGGLCLWLADALVAAFLLRESSLLNALVLELTPRAAVMRGLGLLLFLLLGLVLARRVRTHSGREEGGPAVADVDHSGETGAERKDPRHPLSRRVDPLRHVVDALTHPFYVINAQDYNVRLANSAAREQRVGELKCQAVSAERWEPCQPPRHVCPLRDIPQTGQPVSVEHEYVDAAGERRIVEIHGFPVVGEDGRVQELIEYWVDVTQRRNAEDALRGSEERYRHLFEDSLDPVYVSSLEGRLLDINAAGVKLFGYGSREELLQVDIARDLYVRPEDRDRSRALLLEQGFLRNQEQQIKRRDGRGLVVLESATVVRDESGAPVGFRGFLRDVTGERQLEEQLHHAQKMEAVGTLASGVAHDFNNLLTAIFGYTDLAKETLPDGHAAIRSLEMVEQAARQACGVSRALLTFSQKVHTQKDRVNLSRLVRDTIRLLRRVLLASIEIVDEVNEEAEFWVYADGTQVQQVLMNLAVNARDAMPEGGRLRVVLRPAMTHERASLDRGGGMPSAAVVLAVEDNGVGMTESVRARVFEPFFSTKRRGQGIGLGLSVIHGIVTGHEGVITVDSELNQGTCVTVALPCVAAPEAVPPPSAPPTSIEAAPDAGRATLLVVEDNAQVRSIMCSVLRSDGYGVISASDGIEAATALESDARDVQLVMLDLDLPRQSGLSLLKVIRERHGRLPVIVVTGNVDFNPQQHLGDDDHFLSKPFQMSELSSLVRQVLTQSATKAGARL